MTQDNIEMVPLAAFEAQAERNVRTVKYMSLGWVISVVLLTFALIVSFSYTEEVVTETETYERVATADNMGHAIVGDGEITIGDSTSNSNADNDNA